jgi:hypothetical protein
LDARPPENKKHADCLYLLLKFDTVRTWNS